jgi:hypothetical protein
MLKEFEMVGEDGADIVVRLTLAEIRSRAAGRKPGYAEALLAAGAADADGIHWRIPLRALREIWAAYGAPGLDLEHGGGCAGCGEWEGI